MSDLGNRGWSNSMKLGEDIDLGELLLDPALFVFVLSSFYFFIGSPILGSQNTKKTLICELTLEYIYNKWRKLTA